MSDDEGGCGGFDDLGGDDRELVDAQDAVDLDEEALNLVLSLVDQLHGLRGDMRAILDALAREPVETRVRLKTAIREVRLVVRG